MALGMTYEQYWYGDVRMTLAFIEADKLRQKRHNEEAWLQGMYFYDALAKVSPILRAFAKNGTKAQPYPKQPYGVETKQKSPAEREKSEENERLKALLFFKNWARAASNHFEK